MKTYLVMTQYLQSVECYVNATSEGEAKEKALTLIENGIGNTWLDDSLFEPRVYDCREATGNAIEQEQFAKIAKVNDEALEEYAEDND